MVRKEGTGLAVGEDTDYCELEVGCDKVESRLYANKANNESPSLVLYIDERKTD